MGSSALELLEARVGLQRLAERRCALGINTVAFEAANKAREPLAREQGCLWLLTLSESKHFWSTPDALEGGVDREHLSDLCDALSRVGALAELIEPAELVVVQAASKGDGKRQALSSGHRLLTAAK